MTVREMVASGIPEGAFLRRDRGSALYITNAPMKGGFRAPEGFIAEEKNGIARISIAPDDLEKIAAAMELPEDGLSRELSRFTGSSQAAVGIFQELVKAMENPAGADFPALDRAVRQAAAVALREGGGEGLYHCARALGYVESVVYDDYFRAQRRGRV